MSADELKGEKPISVTEFAARGGRARAELMSPEERSEAARKAAEQRWEREKGKGLLRATHEGELSLGGVVIRAAVLEDGRRVLTQSDFMRGLGRARQAKGRAYYDADVNLPAFLTAKNLKPFVTDDLRVTSSQIEFRPLKGRRAFGYPAELLPKVCDVFLEAEENGALTKHQDHIAARAKILMRALAHVGIVALVDEATGYQEVRDRLALQAIFDRILRQELAKWAKRFPDEFYINIYKLKGWAWPGMQKNRFSIVAHYTLDLIYDRLAPGVRRELENRSPKNEKGQRPNKLHQWLTDDVGHPILAQQLHDVIMLQRLAIANGYGWNRFLKMVNQVLPKYGTTLPLPFSADDASSEQ
jgi:P63C domain-containing protein